MLSVPGLAPVIFIRLGFRVKEKDNDFKKAVDNLDSAQDKMRKSIIDAEKSGVKIPNELKKYAGL